MTDLDPTTTPPTDESPFERPNESPYEPATDTAPATLVETPATLLPRRPVRWPIAIALVALVLVVSAAVAILITGRAPNAKVLGYVPADSIMYGEARLDLPGDQRTALASFLSKFPGFADQAAIDGKLNELMDQFIGDVTGGDQTYTADIEPWFEGELAFSAGSLPDPSALSSGDPSGLKGFHALFLVSVKDEAKATAWFKDLLTSSATATSDEAYNGASLTLLESGSGPQMAFAVLGSKVAVLGDIDSVKAAVDTKGSGPFAGQSDPKAALAATDADHVGFMYVAFRPLLDWASRVSATTGSPTGLDMGTMSAYLPDWEALDVRIEGDAIVLDAVTDVPEKVLGPSDNRSSPVTDHMPASTLFFSVGHDLGPTLIASLDIYRSDPTLKSAMEAIDQAAGILGGTEGAIGWIGDTGLVVNKAVAGVEGGLVILPRDRAAAERTFTSLRNLISIGGAEAGITVTDTPYVGATITTIDLGDISSLAGLGALAGVPPEDLGSSGLPSGHVELAYAITDQVVVLGSGPEFVKHVLDTTAATSIASTDRYKALIGRAGNGTGVLFVDLAAIRGSIETVLAAADPSVVASYEQEVKPFLVPFDALIETSVAKNNVISVKVIVTVK